MRYLFKESIPKKYLSKKIKKIDTSYYEKTILNIDGAENIFNMFNKNFKLNFEKKKLKKFMSFKSITIIGMGGSILGSKAIYSFMKHKIKKKIIFLDNLDEDKIKKIKFNKNLFIVISKSGETLETILIMNLLSKKLNHQNTIIITEDNKNFLRLYSKKNNITFIKHKSYIGGRYSVLSEVGITPSYLMGLNIKNLRKIIPKYIRDNKKFLLDKSKNLSQLYESKNINNLIFFNYIPQLTDFLYWLQQLIAESLGKNGKGLLPIISLAPKDHHSLLQLYLDGPKDKFFYIFSYGNINSKLRKTVNAQKNAFIKALKINKIPFREFQVDRFTEQKIGEMFTYFMLETILVGKNLSINPFNQPAVEKVKFFTKKYLFN